MTAQRSPKRQRQKEQRRAKIEQEIKVYQARRRRRLLINLGVLVVVMAVVGGFILREQNKKTAPAKTKCVATPATSGAGKVPVLKKFDLDTKKNFIAVMKTSLGTIQIKLDGKTSPCTMNSFVYLAKRGFYNGLKFHRIVKGFALQGGDPNGDGSGGPGYNVVDTPPKGFKYTKGLVAMAKTGADPAGTSGSQFFIVPGDGAASLPAEYAVLGKVVSGDDVVQKINEVPTAASSGGGEQSKPLQEVVIISVTITQS
ncbi:MAG: peptidylprolyl isomerase [Actinomycetota bacterium]|nr:peptidylprolyl isomerase [Actinomycetota bacterium]